MDLSNTEWYMTTENKLREIKYSVELWSINLNRNKDVILNRLRIGHTKFKRAHIMAKTDPLLCPTCNNFVKNNVADHCPNFYDVQNSINIHGNVQIYNMNQLVCFQTTSTWFLVFKKLKFTVLYDYLCKLITFIVDTKIKNN